MRGSGKGRRWILVLAALASVGVHPGIVASSTGSDPDASDEFRAALYARLRDARDAGSEGAREFLRSGTISIGRFAGRQVPDPGAPRRLGVEGLIRPAEKPDGPAWTGPEWIEGTSLLYEDLLSEHLPVRYSPAQQVLRVDQDALRAAENDEWPSLAGAGDEVPALLARFAARKIGYAWSEWRALLHSGPLELESMAWSRVREDVLAALDVVRESPDERRRDVLEMLIPEAPLGRQWARRRNRLLEREFLDVVLQAAPASEVDRRWSRRDRLARFVRPVSATWLLDELSESRREPESPPVDPAKLRSFFRRLAVEAWRDGRVCIDHVGGPVTSCCLDLPRRFSLRYEVGIGDGILVGSFQETHLRKGSIWSPRGRPLIVAMAGELESLREDLYEEKLRTWIRDAPVARSGRTDPGDIRWALTASSEAERTRGDVGLVLLRNRRFVFLHCDSGDDIRYRELARRAVLEAAGVLKLGDGADGVLDRAFALEPR